MELLDPVVVSDDLPLRIEKVLRWIWGKPASRGCETSVNWRHQLMSRLGLTVPDHILETTQSGLCLTHGDPTFANTMMRGDQLVLIDPKVPGNGIPSAWHVDAAKVLQSMCGWESVLAGASQREWCVPQFLEDGSEADLMCIAWWLHVHCERILKREAADMDAGRGGNDKVFQWAASVSRGALKIASGL